MPRCRHRLQACLSAGGWSMPACRHRRGPAGRISTAPGNTAAPTGPAAADALKVSSGPARLSRAPPVLRCHRPRHIGRASAGRCASGAPPVLAAGGAGPKQGGVRERRAGCCPPATPGASTQRSVNHPRRGATHGPGMSPAARGFTAHQGLKSCGFQRTFSAVGEVVEHASQRHA